MRVAVVSPICAKSCTLAAADQFVCRLVWVFRKNLFSLTFSQILLNILRCHRSASFYQCSHIGKIQHRLTHTVQRRTWSSHTAHTAANCLSVVQYYGSNPGHSAQKRHCHQALLPARICQS